MTDKKREKFVSLAEARVNRTIKDIQLIGNLSNRGAYDYSDVDIRKIFKALSAELETAKQRFASGNEVKKSEFTLSD